MANVMKSTLGLSNVETRILLKTIRYLYKTKNSVETKVYPTISDIRDHLIVTKEKGAGNQSRLSLLAKLEPLCEELKELLSYSNGVPIEVILQQQLVVFDFSGLLESTVDFITNCLLAASYYHQFENNIRGDSGATHIILLEEIGGFCSKKKEQVCKENFFPNLFIERAREFKFGIVAIAQRPSALTKSLLSNVYTRVMLAMSETEELHYFARSMGLTPEQEKFARKLKIGEGIISSGRFPAEPVPIKIENFPIDKTVQCNNDELVRELQQYCSKGEVSEDKTVVSYKENVLSTVVDNIVLSKNESLLLEEVIIAEDLYDIGYYCKQLGIKKPTGTRIVKSLVKFGLITTLAFKLKTARGGIPTILFPTDKAFEFLSKEQPKLLGRGGIAHRMIVKKMASVIKHKGYTPRIEHQGIDISFGLDGKFCAVELEMSEASVEHSLENLKKDIALGADVIFFVAPDIKVYNKLQEEILGAVPNSHVQIFFYTVAQFLSGLWTTI